MSMQLSHYALRRYLKSLIMLVFVVALGNSIWVARACDHPVPGDTSTRKGVASSEENPCEEAAKPSIESTAITPQSPKSPPSGGIKDSNSHANVALAQWVTEWIKQPRRVTARLAIHGVVPEIELEAVIPAAQQKICANGKCYEVDEKVVQGESCDQSTNAEVDSTQEPIVEAPVAPPVPPTFPFALQCEEQNSSLLEFQIEGSPYALGYLNKDNNDAGNEPVDFYGSLSKVQVSVPASTLVAYMVAHVENSVRLEMTEQLAAERAMYAQRYELLIQHNQQLQTQLAIMEARQQLPQALAMQVAPSPQAEQEKRCQSLTASKEDWDAIQEDLSNIRRQIANLKNSSPIPVAQSHIGNESSNPSRQPQAWRTARSIPYVPVFPSTAKSPDTTRK
jgi:hypothetical protein